ncbi:hypothetical protein QR680_015495 [Steinernema hermaphroditum]|uniref:G-protein coupled receptors family 1 profile domain-containing protein n=1 Tax=Steinernema hermaphroditum TaxID=289476 RepID=A0AA39LKY4_9BILA|nr:hypothetical protein QR680_015495 [Steinernema hermaphroditum]
MGNVFVAFLLNIFTVYLILYKSPKCFKAYKFVLLNISLWTFLSDVVTGVISLPMIVMEILSIYSGGLAKPLGPTVGLASIIACAFCVCEYLVSQLIAFIYRYNELKINSQKMKKWKYWAGIAFLVTVVPFILFAIPLSITFCAFVFELRIMGEMTMLSELCMSFH